MPVRITFRRSFITLCVLATCGAAGYWMTGRWVRSSADETLRRAEECLRDRDNAAARRTLRRLLWFEPDHDRALLITGVSFNADERFSEAIEALERIPESSDSAESAGVALAASLIPDGQLERAESVLTRHRTRFPWSSGGRDRLVRLYLMELRKRDATALLMDHRRRFPDDLTVLPDLLELETANVTPQNLVEPLEAADRAWPGQAPVVLALARVCALTGRIEQARNWYEEALELRPDDPQTRLAAAEFHVDLGELDAASVLLDMGSGSKALDDDRYWFLTCRIAAQSGDFEAARAGVEQALALRPHEEAYLLMQADLLRRMGRVEESVHAATEAARLAEERKRLLVLSDKLDRDWPDAARCLEIADVLERLGQPDLAGDWRRVSSAVEQQPAAPRAPARGFQELFGSAAP